MHLVLSTNKNSFWIRSIKHTHTHTASLSNPNLCNIMIHTTKRAVYAIFRGFGSVLLSRFTLKREKYSSNRTFQTKRAGRGGWKGAREYGNSVLRDIVYRYIITISGQFTAQRLFLTNFVPDISTKRDIYKLFLLKYLFKTFLR